jgi:hypothetical protein
VNDDLLQNIRRKADDLDSEEEEKLRRMPKVKKWMVQHITRGLALLIAFLIGSKATVICMSEALLRTTEDK